MRDTDILDIDIPGADPAAVVAQYEPFIAKQASRYIHILDRSGAVGLDDLCQVGRIAVLKAQKRYDPAGGASFLSFITLPIRGAMRRALGFDNRTGAAPEQLIYLDEPTTEDGGEMTRIDSIPDPSVLPFDEPLIEEETRRETSEQIRAAVERMKSDKQRKAIKLVWLEGKTREQAAAEMEMKARSFCSLEHYGRSTLRRDYRLREYAIQMPSFHIGINKFRSTWTSETEAAVIWRDEHLPEYISRKEAAAEEMDTGRQWTPAQRLAYVNRMKKQGTQDENGGIVEGGAD